MSDGKDLIIGVTGGIGAGKSTVCRLFRECGRSVFSADEIANRLTRSDPGVRRTLRRVFGTRVFTPDGELDRRWLASVVFQDKTKLRKLNAIVHPEVLKTLRRAIRQLPPSKRYPYILVESALIFEAGLERMFDVVLLVHAPLSVRIARIRSQSGLSRTEILRRVIAQISPREAGKKADFSVANSGRQSDLRRAVRTLDRLFSTLAGEIPRK